VRFFDNGEKGSGTTNSKRQLALLRVGGSSCALIPLSGPAALSEFPVLAGHGFDLPIEASVADGLVLIERQLQIAERRVVERAT